MKYISFTVALAPSTYIAPPLTASFKVNWPSYMVVLPPSIAIAPPRPPLIDPEAVFLLKVLLPVTATLLPLI